LRYSERGNAVVMTRSLLVPLGNALRNLRYNYLFLPGVIALAFAALSLATTRLDRTGGEDGVLALFPAGPAAARAVLQTIATTVATVAGVAFSITIVSLQLVSQQFTPRALRGFLGDRLNQTVAGTLLGVFMYCLVALRSVEDGERTFLPGLTVTLAVALAFIALALLLVFVHHMGHSIQVSNIVKRIADATLAAVESPCPSSYGEAIDDENPDMVVAQWESDSPPTRVYPVEHGFVQSLDDIPKAIKGRSFRLQLLVAPGDFVTERHPVARVWTGADPGACAQAVRRAIAIAAERDLRQDVRYGVRQLADIAVKALSPSVNDPTTATTCIGYLQGILERIATTPAPARVRCLADRDVTLVMRRDAFSDYLEALVQISRYATSDARAIDALLHATVRVAQAAAEVGADDRARAASHVAARIARRAAASDAIDEEEREAIATVLEHFPAQERAVQ
jgi:uncharacterized membrane protein